MCPLLGEDILTISPRTRLQIVSDISSTPIRHPKDFRDNRTFLIVNL